MKISASQLWGFLLNPQEPKHIFIYGPEPHLKKNMALDFALSWSQTFHKPYKRFSHIEAYHDSQGINHQGGLFSKSQSTSGFTILGGLQDKNIKTVQNLWDQDPKIQSFICVSSEDVNTKSKLTLHANSLNNCLSVGIYEGSSKWRLRWIHNYIAQLNGSFSPEICHYISENTDDSTDLDALIQKVLLLAPQTPEETSALLQSSEKKLENLVWLFLKKNPIFFIDLKTFLNENPEDSLLFLRSLLQTTLRLHQMAIDYEHNKDIEAALSKASPPLHFKNKNLYLSALKTWNSEKLWHCIQTLNKLEFRYKSQSLPVNWELLQGFIGSRVF